MGLLQRVVLVLLSLVLLSAGMTLLSLLANSKNVQLQRFDSSFVRNATGVATSNATSNATNATNTIHATNASGALGTANDSNNAINAHNAHNSSNAINANNGVPACLRANYDTIPTTTTATSTSTRNATPFSPFPRPVINLGFPKMGTTSLHSFFGCGGYTSLHFRCGVSFSCAQCMNASVFETSPTSPTTTSLTSPSDTSLLESKSAKGVDPLLHCGKADVYAQIDDGKFFPQMELLEELLDGLHGASSDEGGGRGATFILLFRNMTKWFHSISHWPPRPKDPHMDDRWRQMNITGLYPQYPLYPGENDTDNDNHTHNSHNLHNLHNANHAHNAHTAHPAYSSRTQSRNRNQTEDEQLFADWYCRHVQRVRSLLSQTKYPNHVLVEIDIDDPQTPQRLSQWFGIDARCWGRSNTNELIHDIHDNSTISTNSTNNTNSTNSSNSTVNTVGTVGTVNTVGTVRASSDKVKWVIEGKDGVGIPWRPPPSRPAWLTRWKEWNDVWDGKNDPNGNNGVDGGDKVDGVEDTKDVTKVKHDKKDDRKDGKNNGKKAKAAKPTNMKNATDKK